MGWWTLASPWQILAGNLAVVALFVLGWAHARFWLRNMPRPLRLVLFGATMGAGAVASMSMAVPLENGVFFDLRASLLMVSAFFGGLPAALISISIAATYRLLIGGAGMWVGLAGILLTSGTGLALGQVMRGKTQTALHMLLLGVAAASITILTITALPHDVMIHAMRTMALPVALLTVLATTLAGMVYLQARRLSAERDLLAAALAQSPDYAYVKDEHGRFTAVNNATFTLHGFASADEMIGKTDFDLTTPERAAALLEQELAVLASGVPLLDFEEELTNRAGEQCWYSTAKVPLHNNYGEVIGLAGVTRDITTEKRLQRELTQSRDTLSFALEEMSDGLAMFDSGGYLLFCNEQYRDSFPYSGSARQPGAHMADILRVVVETGEQITVPRDNVEGWIEQIVANLHRESEEEVNLFDGRWLQIRTRPASNGATLVVVTDVTRIKQAEVALHSTTDELKHLVRTDGLTGLLNRRAFDDVLDGEIRRTGRAGTPLSLLLIDVDHFKAFNDHYGHPAGDDCLQRLSQVLKTSLKRPADTAARYGGEEFAAILPDTDEDGAYLVAESFRRALADIGITHRGGDKGHVTASVGVATYMPDNLRRSAPELIQAADEALYSAKAAGRDRVFGRRVTSEQKRYAGH
jgi:diguanylate cyclase (GGDEF)-like protein/PAS domain S-box-containing protein